jgi:hypothetical protein
VITSRILLPALLVAFVLACTPGSDTSEPAAASTTSTQPQPKPSDPVVAEPGPTDPVLPDAPTFASGPFEVRVENIKPILPTQAFSVEGPDESMQDHAWSFGWTADGSAFAYCETFPMCTRCTFTRPDGEIEKLVTRECGENGTKASERQMKARIDEQGVAVRNGDWAHGGELVVTTRSVFGPPDKYDHAPAILVVGSARRDGLAEGDVFREDACFKGSDGETTCFNDAHADAIVPSPDGASVAILGHMYAGEWSDTFVVEIMPAGRLAAAAYNRQGLDALERGDFEAASTAFLAVMHADPIAWKGPYNLACAYARAADPRVQPALQVAVERGGDAVREKAAKDADLEGVRSQAWFTALVSPTK